MNTENSMANHSEDTRRALRILAKSVFKELERGGYGRTDMVAFASELLELVGNDPSREMPDAE
ncbi:MAG: hypothetical protein Q8Q09_19405 [Deltaproteobacteria bacterium]|nr:hypothetical protein [Deltaproteobacteria bacterium]